MPKNESQQTYPCMMPRSDLRRVLEPHDERVVITRAVGRHVERQPRRVHRRGERHRVVGVVGTHRTRREHDDLVRVGADAGVALGAPHHDAVGPLLHHVHVVVGIGLRVRRQRAVALHVGLGHRHREIGVAAVLVERLGARQRLALEHAEQPEQGVGPDLLDQRDHRPAEAGDGLDQARPRQQILGRPRDRVVRAELLAGVRVLRHREVAVQRIVPDLVVERGVIDGDAQVGNGQDVGNAPTAVPEHAAVAERRPVLVSGREAHRGTVDGHDQRWP